MSSDINNPCIECDFIATHSDGTGDVAFSDAFVIHAKLGDSPVPAWMIVAPRRHIEQLDELSADEASELGPLLVRLGHVVRRVSRCEKIYVSIFAEQLHHLHIHVIGRPDDLAAAYRGPAIFSMVGEHRDRAAMSTALLREFRET